MEGSLFLSLCEGLHIERVTASANELRVQVLSSSPKACCPLCGTLAWRIHSRYMRQVTDLVPSYARLTTRLREALVAIGFATSGEVTSRLAPRLGMQVAPTTLLRRVRAIPVAQAGKVRVLGVDDFAWKAR